MAEDDCSNLTYSDAEDDVQHRKSYDNDDYDEQSYEDDYDDDQDEHTAETIALFGASSPTGHHFLRLALDAGYRVRALVKPGMKLDGEFEDLHTVVGTLDDTAILQEVVYSSTYVVCMLGETPSTKHRDSLQNFVKTLYSIMIRQDEPPIKGFLFQATSLASDGRGKKRLPLLTKVMRKVNSLQKHRSSHLQDMDAAIQFIASQKKKVGFSYIVTRPSIVLRDGPSTKKLAASKSVSKEV